MRKLQELLAANNWKEADTLTANMILEVANRENIGWLRDEDMDKVPCELLSTINRLWVDYSNGHFGFSVQKEIYQRFGVTREYDQIRWQIFGNNIGWRVNNQWIGQNCTFDLSVPKGHLPVMGVWVEPSDYHDDWVDNRYWYGWSLATTAWYSEVTSWHIEDIEDVCHCRFSSFMSRVINCNVCA
ncbi:serine/threonine kinase (plasmid) [Calothrix sp. NIES-4071]|nr:serine/threonine kinase [Calothrix sp. NIES-4071]BAZ65083.1 serine/threonine kinase [Calothrix sp. NIES-4105]